MSDKWSVCDIHEQVYLKNGGFCKDCRIAELEADRDVHKRHHEKLSTQVIHLKHTMDEMKEARDKRIKELEQKHNALLERLEGLQRYTIDNTVPLQITTHHEGDFVLTDDLDKAIKEARDENDR